MTTPPGATYTVTAHTHGDGTSTAVANGQAIRFDSSPTQGDELPGPADLLTAAFAACMLKNVGDGEQASGAQYPVGLAEHDVLVGGQVDDAVRDDDVDRLVGQRESSRVPRRNSPKVSRHRPGSGGEVEHLGGHVEAVAPCRGADPAGGQQTSMPPPEPRYNTLWPCATWPRRWGCRTRGDAVTA